LAWGQRAQFAGFRFARARKAHTRGVRFQPEDMQEDDMRLNAPTQMVFLISLALAVLALIGHFVSIPYLTVYQFWVAIVAYAVLAAACVMKGM
jgi:hypothetical protein